MFPDEFYPSSGQERLILTRLLTKMFPEQLESLRNWKELAIPSVLIHLAPEKFAQVDYKHLNKYINNDNVSYSDTGNLRELTLRVLVYARKTLPELANSVLTPEIEDKLRQFLRESTWANEIKQKLPYSNKLEPEWLFDRFLLKIKNSSSFDDFVDTASMAPEPTTQTTTQPTTTSKPASHKCNWGPILCSINRVSFQRKLDRRGEVEELKESPSSTIRRPKDIPQWLRLSRRKAQPNNTINGSLKNPNRGANVFFRRLLMDQKHGGRH